ncbi:MAG: HAMP domain-containing sensor histidine kinase [Pseudomonadota bacterium]|nr:HAMP domain-containing sensor histidine kinase [Pseudomonadota bacterium]
MYKRKLYLFGLLSTFILLIALASAAVSAHLTRTNLAQSQLAQALLSEHQQLSSISYRLFKQLTDELIFGKDANQAKVRNKQQLINQSILRIKQLELEQREALGEAITQGSVEDTDALEQLIQSIVDEFRAISLSNDSAPLYQQQRLQNLLEITIDNQFREAINSAVIRQTRVVSDINARIETLNSSIVWFTISLGLITCPFILLGCYWLFNALYQPLTIIRTGTDAIASGNYQYRLPETLDDEFTDLVKALNSMIARLSEHEDKAAAYRKQLEFEVETRTRALKEANSKLTQIDAKRRQFMADVSHELRTPLTIIRGEAQVTLRQHSADNDVYKETLQTILEQAVNLSKLVDDLLLLARAEMHEFTLDFSKHDLHALLEQQVRLWQKVTKSREFILNWTLSQPVDVFIDEGRIIQALTILVENAHKYSREQEPIAINVSACESMVCIHVVDIGDGISSSDLDHIFERFVRLKRKGDGMGLGLSIAKAIAEAHGGQLEAKSTLGEGSTFTLMLPADYSGDS